MASNNKDTVSAVLTANDLLTGDVVYWAQQGHWSRHAEMAERAIDADQRQVLTETGLAQEAANLVVGAYLVDLSGDGVNARPKLLREARRRSGPSIALPIHKTIIQSGLRHVSI